MSIFSGPSTLPFDRWDADDALDALHRAGLDLDHVEQARWPANAPQPRTHRQAFTFRSPGIVDPHLLLVFDAPEALEAWRLWLARYWKARPYLSVRDNVLLLVSRELPETAAARFHEALARLGSPPAPTQPTGAAGDDGSDAPASPGLGTAPGDAPAEGAASAAASPPGAPATNPTPSRQVPRHEP